MMPGMIGTAALAGYGCLDVHVAYLSLERVGSDVFPDRCVGGTADR